MIALQITINGKELYTAGIEDWNSIHAILALQNGPRGQAPSFDLNVGGRSAGTSDDSPCDSVRWKTQFLQEGDEISIKIVDTDNVDPPVKRLKRKNLKEKYDPQYTDEELEKMDLEMYRKLKQKFENEG